MHVAKSPLPVDEASSCSSGDGMHVAESPLPVDEAGSLHQSSEHPSPPCSVSSHLSAQYPSPLAFNDLDFPLLHQGHSPHVCSPRLFTELIHNNEASALKIHHPLINGNTFFASRNLASF